MPQHFIEVISGNLGEPRIDVFDMAFRVGNNDTARILVHHEGEIAELIFRVLPVGNITGDAQDAEYRTVLPEYRRFRGFDEMPAPVRIGQPFFVGTGLAGG